jgi:hypothetical protein
LELIAEIIGVSIVGEEAFVTKHYEKVGKFIITK